MKGIEAELYKWILSNRDIKNVPPVLGVDHCLDHRQVSRFAISMFADALKLSSQFDRSVEADLKLRLALHLCPADALNWDSTSPKTRVEVIADYIEGNFGYQQDSATELARVVAATLRAWETRRAKLANRTESILKRQDGRCSACHVVIDDSRILEEEKKTASQLDPYKPFSSAPGVRSWLAPQVDHKDPVSVFGTNDWSNLQVLCRLCNSGKGDGSSMSIKLEFDHCHSDIGAIKCSHRRRLLYCRIEMDDFRCTKCRSDSNELTVRKRFRDGCLALSNLVAVCYNCATAMDA